MKTEEKADEKKVVESGANKPIVIEEDDSELNVVEVLATGMLET